MNLEITLPSEKDLLEFQENNQLFNRRSLSTDLAIITGGYYEEYLPKEEEKTVRYWTRDLDSICYVKGIGTSGEGIISFSDSRVLSIRPLLKLSQYMWGEIVNNYFQDEVLFGSYPQYVLKKEIQDELDNAFNKGLIRETDNIYTFDHVPSYVISKESFRPDINIAYEYQNKKYIRTKIRSFSYNINLANNDRNSGDYIWVEILPISWYVDRYNYALISKKCLLSGIRLDKEAIYNGNFEKTEMNIYLNKYMLKEITQEKNFKKTNFCGIIYDSQKAISNFEEELDKNSDLSKEDIELLRDALAQEKKIKIRKIR